MSLKLVHQATPASAQWDKLKWLFVGILLVGGIIGNYCYAQVAWPLRLLGWVFLILVILGLVGRTLAGKHALHFARESQLELRKVVWPTRHETLQTTLVVAIMVVVLSLILWGMDGLLMWLIGCLTGQRS